MSNLHKKEQQLETYIALLRGINVSGKNKLPMAELRALAESLGYRSVKTYIQSGNLLFQYADVPATDLSNQLKDAIKGQFDYEVPVLTLSRNELERIVVANPFLVDATPEIKSLHVTLLDQLPDADLLAAIKAKDFGADQFEVVERSIYLHCSNGYGRTKLTNTFFERKLKVQATTRNWKTMLKVQEMSGAA
ncbi:MAG: DUF1697 domain-containing protein [Bacteroidota bacterium]